MTLSASPTAQPTVSVVIPIYNGAADLPDLLSCLEQQTYTSENLEYLLVDNNSQDNTAHLIAEAVKTTSIPLKLLSETEIQSSYAARNRGIQSSTSDLIAFTDADCRPEPTWLEQLLQPFNQPEIGLVAGEILALPPQTFLEHYAEQQKTLCQAYTLEHPYCPYGQTANLAIRRQALETVGLFRPHLTTGGDADLCWRILRGTDWQLKFAQQAIVRHRHRATWEELEKQWRRYGESNRYLHELHGVDLQPTQSPVRPLLRWFLKSLPRETLKLGLGRGNVVSLFAPLIGVYTSQARQRGQAEAQLPDAARDIEYMEKP
ncbi:MAG: glycosyltransferase [Phormidium sp. BM_Day4_Bin.17]|nr:glycosyltransferase [Phormidium sp. BM_Day4_Bin.17]UCJ11423.1 MAG: glycosyltransferase [Phormidium sp. PBR-2020]